MKKAVKYDFLIVGAGLFGCVCAKELTDRGCRVLVIDRRKHVGGNCAVRMVNGQPEHVYGPHIFHTDKKFIWDYLNDIEEFIPYKHRVVAVHGGLQYDFPINRLTLVKVFGENTVNVPFASSASPSNFEEAAVSRIGERLYRMFYHDYTAKQWGRDPTLLPAEIFSRVPVRFDYNDSYFNDKYTGVLSSNRLFEKLLNGASLKLNCAFNKRKHGEIARCIIYTGMVDEYENYCLGRLPYRSLRFEKRRVAPYENQGIAVVNFTDARPYTRTCEYGYMYGRSQIGGNRWYEYPIGEFDQKGRKTEPYYPLPTPEAKGLYHEYVELIEKDFEGQDTIIKFGGRLGSYQYINMDQAVEQALHLVEEIFTQNTFKKFRGENNYART